MRKLLLGALVLGLTAFGTTDASAQTMQASEDVEMTAQVVDLACKTVFDLSGEGHRECAQACADSGIILGLLDEDGNLYMPVTAGMAAGNDNARLKGHAEHTVRVTGKVFKRGDFNAIMIESIEM